MLPQNTGMAVTDVHTAVVEIFIVIIVSSGDDDTDHVFFVLFFSEYTSPKKGMLPNQ